MSNKGLDRKMSDLILIELSLFATFFQLSYAVLEVNHLRQTDSLGRTVHMDIMHDVDDKTVLVTIGDVSMYSNGQHTVNFHDYSTGYGALKNINNKLCILAKSPEPMATAEKYRIGITDDVHAHFLDVDQLPITNEDVKTIAGDRVAMFCKDYVVHYARPSSLVLNKRASSTNGTADNWCAFSICEHNLFLDLFG